MYWEPERGKCESLLPVEVVKYLYFLFETRCDT